MSIKWEKDLSVREEPSAILLGIETEHLLICEVSPNSSHFGKESSILETSLGILIPKS